MDSVQIKKMFGVNDVPRIGFSLQDIPLKAQEMAGRMSISGVQPKLSVRFDKRLGEIVPAMEKGEYILKPQLQQFPHIPENENCCMDIAASLGIDVPGHCLLGLSDGTLAYIIKRFDRKASVKIHQEDFFQILGKRDKYQGSIEQIGKKLGEISTVPGLDVQLFFERVVFSFLIGNGDAHFKNFSILYHEPGGARLSPAYDIVCSKIVIPGEPDSALTVNGKKSNLSLKDFEILADLLEIPPKVRYERFEGRLGQIKKVVQNSLMPASFKTMLVEILNSRYARLKIRD